MSHNLCDIIYVTANCSFTLLVGGVSMVSIWTGSIRISKTTVENEFGERLTLDEIIKGTTIPAVELIPGMKVFTLEII